MANDYKNTRHEVEIRQAYAAGIAAGQLGGKARNPYRRGSEAARAWERGYASAQAGRVR